MYEKTFALLKEIVYNNPEVINLLGQLHIKNIGIIDDITINFEDGFNVLTGETGAGKSLIIGSISAVTGNRISKEMLKSGAEMAFIEACFFEGEENVILSREIYSNGRNICKIDGKMVTLAELKKRSETLLDIHGQHDNQSLLNPATHLNLLDSFIGKKVTSLLEEYKSELIEYKSIKKELQTNFGDEKDRTRQIDLLQYQINEIEDANLQVGEEEELQSRRTLIMNSEKIAKALNNTYYNLNDIVIDNLGIATHELSSIASFDSKYDNILLALNEAYYSLKDSASETLDCINNVEFDEHEQEQIEERLDLISTLKRKYGNDIKTILNYYNEISLELEKLQNSDEIIQKLQIQLNQKETILKDLAIKIRTLRKKFADEICEKVKKEFTDLEMKNAYIEFKFKELEVFAENGMDDVEIFISTNLGEEPKPLIKTASGGEISRIMLALKTVLHECEPAHTMIFDEIDTGISGQSAKKVGEKMKKISQKNQLICITHLPVIAAMGDKNYLISKKTDNGKTLTSVSKLNPTQTENEIARMLDGDHITPITLEHAKALISLGRSVC